MTVFRISLFAVLCMTVSPSLQAKYASIIIEADSGRVLHETNADTRNYPASLTKMMTLYMVFSALKEHSINFNTQWKVSRSASRQPPSKLGLKPGQKITVKNSILALVTKSANDVAVVVADNLGGSEAQFANMMTRQAKRLKMNRTTFKNASGLPNAGQKSSARDLSKLAQALMTDFPEYYYFFSTRKFKYGRRVYGNHNKLLRSYQGTDGIKTGYIRASGYNLVASTKRNGKRLIGVVMGGKSSRARNRHMMSLLDKGFAIAAKEPARYVSIPPRSQSDRSTVTLANISAPPIKHQKTVYTSKHQPQYTDLSELFNWGVQVGAFSFPNSAETAATKAKQAAPQLLGKSHIVVSPHKTRKKTIYRARLTGIAKLDAHRACQKLNSQDIACITVPPINRQVALVSMKRRNNNRLVLHHTCIDG